MLEPFMSTETLRSRQAERIKNLILEAAIPKSGS